jgi:hypothetical protein
MQRTTSMRVSNLATHTAFENKDFRVLDYTFVSCDKIYGSGTNKIGKMECVILADFELLPV